MLEPTKPHILNLKAMLETAFTHAHDHCTIHYATLDVGGQEGAYFLQAREFAAALNLLDHLVKDDRFLTPKCLQDCRHALGCYRGILKDQGYYHKCREIDDLIHQIDTVSTTTFGN